VPYTATIDGVNMPFEAMTSTSVGQTYLYEPPPQANQPFNILFRNDSLGFQSANTGYFFMFKQGVLQNQDFNLAVEDEELDPNGEVDPSPSNVAPRETKNKESTKAKAAAGNTSNLQMDERSSPGGSKDQTTRMRHSGRKATSNAGEGGERKATFTKIRGLGACGNKRKQKCLDAKTKHTIFPRYQPQRVACAYQCPRQSGGLGHNARG
jgi:hypothetical protein